MKMIEYYGMINQPPWHIPYWLKPFIYDGSSSNKPVKTRLNIRPERYFNEMPQKF